jgi:hypothetical protein
VFDPRGPSTALGAGRFVDSPRLRAWAWCSIIVGIGTLFRIPQTLHALTGSYAFRMAQTAFPVREYAEHGVQLFQVPLPVFGNADSVPFEFPLFQVLARELMYLGISDGTATRLLGLLSFECAAVLWWVLLLRWHGSRLAFVTLVLMQLLPFGLHWGAAALIDFFSVALGLALVLCADAWLRVKGPRGLVLLGFCVLFAWLLFLVKITTVPTIGVLLLIAIALAMIEAGWRRLWRRALVVLVVGPGTALIPFVAWTRYADRTKAEAAATEFLTSANVHDFMFGGSRVSAASWSVIGDRIAGDIAGWMLIPIILGLVVVGLAGSVRTRVLVGGLSLGVLAPMLIVFNLYYVHTYYLIAVYPLLVALTALAPVTLSELLPRRAWLNILVPAVIILTQVASTAASPLGRADIRDLTTGAADSVLARRIDRITPADARIVMVGCDWDPQTLYLAKRTGLMFRQSGQRIAAVWREEDIDDYGYVARCNANVPIQFYLPHGYRWVATQEPGVYRIRPVR